MNHSTPKICLIVSPHNLLDLKLALLKMDDARRRQPVAVETSVETRVKCVSVLAVSNQVTRTRKVVWCYYELIPAESHICYSFKQRLSGLHPLAFFWLFNPLAPPKGKTLPRLCPSLDWHVGYERWWLSRLGGYDLNELTQAVWRHLILDPLTTLLCQEL